MDDLCIFGPVSKDVIYHDDREVMTSMGGVPTYAGLAASQLGLRVQIITKWAETDAHYFAPLWHANNVSLQILETAETTSFCLIYRTGSDANRTICLTALSSPFHADDLAHTDAPLIYLAPLMQNDIGPDVIQKASQKSSVALDVQGLLRRRLGDDVKTVDWPEKMDLLPHIQFLKASQEEAAQLTGLGDPIQAARQIAEWGAKEVVITRDRWGAHILKGGKSADIPAFAPPQQVDTTGCGDTFFAAYLCERHKGADPEPSARFAAAAAALKIAEWGPSQANRRDILNFMLTAPSL